MSEALAAGLVRRPALVLAAVLALTAALIPELVDLRTGALRTRIETDVDGILPVSGEERRLYDRFREVFGTDDRIFVALVGEEVFTAENLERVRRITAGLEALDGIARVTSLANTPDLRSVGGEISARPFVERVPEDPAALAALRAAALENPVYAGNLVSRDGRAAVLMIEPEPMSELEFLDRGLDREIERIARDGAGAARVVVAGPPVVKAATARMLVRDLAMVGPGTFLFMALVAGLTFRSWRGLLVPTLSIGLAQLWTIGTVVVSGRSLNLVTTIVPPLVNTVGFAYAVHVVAEYDAVVRELAPRSSREAVREALRRVVVPVLLCALTTAAGCASLLTSPLGVIREFGTFCSVGVGASVLAALTFTPAVLALLPLPRSLGAGPADHVPERIALALGRFAVRRNRLVLWASAGIAVLALAVLPRIEVSTSLVSNFASDSPLRQDIEAFDALLAGSMTFNVVVEGGARDALKEPAALREIEALQTWLESQPEIGDTTSIADHVRVAHRAFRGGDPEALAIPESRRLVAQLLFFLWDERLATLVDRKVSTASIAVRAPYLDSREASELFERIEERLAALPPPLSGHVTGNTPMIVRTIDEIALGQALSLSAASILIAIILVATFRSVRIGLVALLPNALPVLAFFGILGLTGVTLNVTTSLIATIVLGIAVDATVHFLVRYRWLAAELGNAEHAVLETLRLNFRPVTATSLALMLGFLVLVASHLEHQIEFGALAAGTLGFAWLMDVTMTPALAYRMGVPEQASPPSEPGEPDVLPAPLREEPVQVSAS